MVALIVYPAEGANSFVTIEEADLMSEQFIGYESCQNKTEDDRKRCLIAAFYKINLLDDIIK